VLPPPSYRQREPETHEPEPVPPFLPTAETNGLSPESGLLNHFRTRRLYPAWIVQPFAFLGLWFVISQPLGMGWYGYAAGIIVAVVIGIRVRSRYTQRIPWRGKLGREFVVWLRYGQRTPPPSLPSS
jgi:hypothetical protein